MKRQLKSFWDMTSCSLVEVDRHFCGKECVGLFGLLVDPGNGRVRSSEKWVNFDQSARHHIPEVDEGRWTASAR
jgi:hypothetical protein